MRGNWMLWTAIVLIGFWIVRIIIEPPVPGYIMFLTSLTLPLAVFFLVFWYIGRRRRRGEAPRPSGPDKL